MQDLRQGQVYWYDFGPSNGSAPAERHPCVVVQNDTFNQTRISTTVVCLITSNLSRARAPGNVLLGKGEANLPKACAVNISQLMTVDKSELVEEIGTLSIQRLKEINQGLTLLLEVSRPLDLFSPSK
ncbi:MAG: type II toxin-antitoxin system PemK/MazF family toxin [Acidobacteriota bacterium]